MKRIVLTFGLISGAVLAAMMLATIPFIDQIGFGKAEVIGYTSMIAAGMLICFGIRSYRENVGGGQVGFGRAFSVGMLITLISCACYAATWQVIYYKLVPDFYERYGAHVVEQARAAGAPQAEIDRKAAEARKYAAMSKNPLVNFAIAFVEPIPVGLIITLVCAGVMSRKRPARSAGGRAGVPVVGT